MNTHEILGQISGLHQMMHHLLDSVPEQDAYRSYLPGVPPLAWLFGRSAYIETYWLREVVEQDPDMTTRVRHFFGHGVNVDEALAGQLPPREHLINWALELQDDNLMRLANPARLPSHPLVEDDRLALRILTEHARLYELMLVQLTERQLRCRALHSVSQPLAILPPATEHADVLQGHYRIGAKTEPYACDNELPTQVVELDAYRIDRKPVSNGAYLGFIEAGGYASAEWWSEEGWAWREAKQIQRPYHWRKDLSGRWHGIGLNGPFDLVAEEPVSGVSQHEAHAYANWVSSHGGELAGAILQHEYQWETALRSQAIDDVGRVWEWCANAFHPYTGYQRPQHAEAASEFEAGHVSLRGGCLHSQPILRRSTYRHHSNPAQRHHFSGIRLVFPASIMPWQS